MDTELIGWRAKENEVSPHYYRKDDRCSGADAISLCEKFYASRNELVFPGPGMNFCSECGEIALKIAEENPEMSHWAIGGVRKEPGREESHLGYTRRLIEDAYRHHPTGCGGSFGELLCYELHTKGMTFKWLAKKWGISLPVLGELIWDHCKRLEELPIVDHDIHDIPDDETSPARR